MTLCAAVALLLPIFLTGCPTTSPNERSQPAAKTKQAEVKPKKKPPTPSIPDQNGDTAFLAFVGRLRGAVAAHDAQTVGTMMVPDFVYLPDPVPGDSGSGQAGAFAYFDAHDLWPEMQLILRERFVPYEKFMVAPPEFAAQESNYKGYRAGLALVNGSWRFVYFVKGE